MNTKKTVDTFVFLFIAGGSCSGKSYLADSIKKMFMDASIIRQDWYYKDIQFQEDDTLEKFEAFDVELLFDNIQKIIRKSKVLFPTYSYKLHRRINLKRQMKAGPKLIIIEGLYAVAICDLLCRKFWFEKIPKLKIWVDVTEKTMLNRRVKRDITRTNQSKNEIIAQMKSFVLPAYRKYIKNQFKHSDIIFANNKDNIDIQHDLNFIKIIDFIEKKWKTI